MHKKKHDQHHHEGADHEGTSRGPYWKRAHRDWRFILAIVLMLAAMAVYVLSDDLAGWPGSQPRQPMMDAIGN